MSFNNNYVNRFAPEQIIKIYGEDGIVITVDQANQIIEFLYMIAEIALDNVDNKLWKEKRGDSNPKR